MAEKLIYELSKSGRVGYTLPLSDVPTKDLKKLLPEHLMRDDDPLLPEISENEVVRHFIRLSMMNYHVDFGFYPLGSCTMKYNPKINEVVARLPGFTDIHPLQPDQTVQGALSLMKELEEMLAEIAGMDAVTLQPAAGAHAELTGMLITRKYFETKGEKRKVVLLPDSAHGTNPASATLCGFESKTIRSNKKGTLDIQHLKENLNEDVAAIMITNPNTLGIFEEQILEVAELVHSVGAIMYLDGANLNALLGKTRPGDTGFDIVHFNLHKTFSTPHGGGGPGAGAIGVKAFLAPFLPVPRIVFKDNKFSLDWDHPQSIGKIHSFYGNFSVMVRAYTYIRMMGTEGLKNVAEAAVLNANYLMNKLKPHLHLPYDRPCMHEFVVSAKNVKKETGIRTLDIAKRLLDYGFHAPTVYFPLIVPEALMIEPTETETKETLDEFCNIILKIIDESRNSPQIVKTAPHNTPVGRLDEVKANRELNLRYTHKD